MSIDITKIDEDKLPIRYVIGIQNRMEDFPNALDILHIFISRAVSQPDRQKSTFTKHGLVAYHAKGRNIQINLGLSDAIKKGYIECVNETKGKESYRILINPFL